MLGIEERGRISTINSKLVDQDETQSIKHTEGVNTYNYLNMKKVQ